MLIKIAEGDGDQYQMRDANDNLCALRRRARRHRRFSIEKAEGIDCEGKCYRRQKAESRPEKKHPPDCFPVCSPPPLEGVNPSVRMCRTFARLSGRDLFEVGAELKHGLVTFGAVFPQCLF